MKDITRIHIAKVTYNIEPVAKKELATYLDDIRNLFDDDEAIEDIEVRITELLHERNIKSEGVISADDVAAIREQLGEPEAFRLEGSDEDTSENPPETTDRKLFRDTERAIAGGVVSGLSQYFRNNSGLMRLFFIAAVILSGGLALVVYLVAWAIIPPARTAADKLRMRGKAVTISSLQASTETDDDAYEKLSASRVRRLIRIVAGVTSVLAAVSTIGIFIAIWISYTYTIDGVTETALPVYTSAWALPADSVYLNGLQIMAPYYLGAFILTGLLITTLFLLLAHSAFRASFTKRKLIASIVIGVMAIVIPISAVITADISFIQEVNTVQRNRVDNQIAVPSGFGEIKKLDVSVPNYIDVSYVVDPTVRSITLNSTKGLSVNASVKDRVAHITYIEGSLQTAPLTTLVIYGPALDSIDANSSHLSYVTNEEQLALSVTARTGGSVSLPGSAIGTVSAKLDGLSTMVAYESRLKAVVLDISDKAYVSLATIQSLTIKSPTTCASGSKMNVMATNVRDAYVTHNDNRLSAVSLDDGCLNLMIGEY